MQIDQFVDQMKFKKEENENKFKSLCKSNSFKNAKSLTQYKILLTIAHSIKVSLYECTIIFLQVSVGKRFKLLSFNCPKKFLRESAICQFHPIGETKRNTQNITIIWSYSQCYVLYFKRTLL